MKSTAVAGGIEPFKAEIAKIRKRDTRMTLYIDHRFCWKNTETARRYGKAWGTMNQLGNYNGYISSDDLYLMCFYDADKWVKYMSDTCFRLMDTLKLDGIYLDELGIAFPCYHPDHDHTQKGEFPTSPQDLGRSLAQVRSAMKKANPEAALMTEHAGSDYLTQFYDGSWDQTFIRRFDFSEKYFDDMRLCIFRFYFPNFKLSSWGASSHHAKRNLFNGMGMDLGGAANKDEQRLYAQVMKENGDAFASEDIEPIVKTSHDKFLANRFPGKNKIIHTIYNTSDKTISGSVLEKNSQKTDWHYVELIEDKTVNVNAKGVPELTVAPERTAVLAAFPRILTVQNTGKVLNITFPGSEGDNIVICEGIDDEHFLAPRGKWTKLPAPDGKAVYTIKNTNAGKYIVKLFKNNYLVDEIVITR